jgi:hypothetical protein
VARVDRLILWHLRGGAGAAAFNAIAFILLTSTVISVEAGQVSFHPRGLYIIGLLLALGYGVLRHSRVCAVWLLLLYAVGAPKFFREGTSPLVIAIVLILGYLFLGAVWATFAWHRRAKVAAEAPDAAA